jgi:hypothetical protein
MSVELAPFMLDRLARNLPKGCTMARRLRLPGTALALVALSAPLFSAVGMGNKSAHAAGIATSGRPDFGPNVVSNTGGSSTAANPDTPVTVVSYP